MRSESSDERLAAHGEKMIELRVRLWTNGIAKSKGSIVPRHAWDSGVVRIEPNASHEISGREPIPFNSFAELPSVIEKLLLGHGIKIHLDNKRRRYLIADD